MVSRILIVYRGHCDRVKADIVYRNYKLKLLDPLERLGILVDCILTYPETQTTAQSWIDLWKPMKFHTIPAEHCVQQVNTFYCCLKYLSKDIALDKYEWIVFLRYDVIYRIPISSWGLFEKNAGIVVPFRENSAETWSQKRYVSDVVIALSPIYLQEYSRYYERGLKNIEEHFFHGTLHEQPKLLEGSAIPLEFMFEGFYQSNTARKPEGPLTSASDPRLSPFHVIFSKPSYAGYSYRDCFES